MSIERQLAEIVRVVVREEVAAAFGALDLELLTVDQVAVLLKFTDRHSVYKLRRERKLRAVNLGGRTLRFRRSEVQRFITEREDLSLERLPTGEA